MKLSTASFLTPAASNREVSLATLLEHAEGPVSYTHLTLPTRSSVDLGGRRIIKKKKKGV